ncbi:hypothetical protein ABPG72_002575 [Tetrahymena utriculariae]
MLQMFSRAKNQQLKDDKLADSKQFLDDCQQTDMGQECIESKLSKKQQQPSQSDKTKLCEQEKQEDEDQGVGCRICLEESEDRMSGKLGNYCNCKGSISKLHVNCLEVQLQLQFKDSVQLEKELNSKCELCQTKYRLSISKRVQFNPANYIKQKVTQKKKILMFLVVIFALSFYTSYVVNRYIKEYICYQNSLNHPSLQTIEDQQSQNSTTQQIDSKFPSIEQFDLKSYLNKNSSNKVNKMDKKSSDFKDSIQVTLSYLLIGFFCTTALFSFIMLGYNLFTIFLYFDVYISKKNLQIAQQPQAK